MKNDKWKMENGKCSGFLSILPPSRFAPCLFSLSLFPCLLSMRGRLLFDGRTFEGHAACRLLLRLMLRSLLLRSRLLYLLYLRLTYRDGYRRLMVWNGAHLRPLLLALLANRLTLGLSIIHLRLYDLR